jgi:hypothetical protein
MRIHRGTSAATLAGILLALPLAASAQTQPTPPAALPAPAPAPPLRTGPSVALVVEGVIEIGGDRVAETFFEDHSSQTMRAGQGGTVAVGAELRPSHGSPLGVRATVGFKYVTTAATNVDIKLTRVPVEVVGTYTFPSGAFVGGGYVRHSRIRFDGGGLAPDVDFDDAQGATLEAGWRWVAVSYTKLTYTDEFGNEYDASAPGLSLRGTFRLD